MAITHTDRLRASVDFMQDWQAALLAGGCAAYLAGRVVLPLLGKSVDSHPYLAKMNAQFVTFWAFDDMARVLSAAFLVGKDIITLRDSRSNQEIRKGQEKTEQGTNNSSKQVRTGWVHRPNEEMTLDDHDYLGGYLKGRQLWVIRRVTGTVLKAVSAFVLVHEGLKTVGALKSGPSTSMKAWGAVLGATGIAQDIYDLEQRKTDYNTDPLHDSIVTRYEKGEQNSNGDNIEGNKTIKEGEFNQAYVDNLFYTQVTKVLVFGVKMMALLSTLNQAEVGGLMGRVTNNRVSNFLVKHSEHIFNGTFLTMLANCFWQHVTCGLVLNKHKEKEEKGLYKYVLKEFAGSRELVRLIEGTATTLLDFGIDALAAFDVEHLGNFAKGFDGFLYVPSAFGRVNSVVKDVTDKNVWKAVQSILKLIADTGAALKFIASFGGIAYISQRAKMLGYIKNVFSTAAASMAVFQEFGMPEKEWSKKSDKETLISLLNVTGALGSIMLNVGGGLSSAFGHLLTPPAKPLPPSYYNINKLMATASVFFKNCTERAV